MNNNEKVSVIIPTFNREKTIKRAIESCLNQTYKNTEIIVVDDCSFDNTEKIVKDINDVRVQYYKLDKNSGACVARNKGIELSTGKYIAFQDSDDEWDKNKLEKQINNLMINNSDVDFCMINVIGEKTNKINVKPEKKELFRIKRKGIKESLCYNSFISTQSIVGKREAFKEVQFDAKLPRLQDYDLMLRMTKKYKITMTKEALVNVYVQQDSISKSNKRLIEATNIMLHKDYNLSDIQEKIFKASLNRILGDCYRENDKVKAKEYYKQTLKNKFDLKTLVKSILI